VAEGIRDRSSDRTVSGMTASIIYMLSVSCHGILASVTSLSRVLKNLVFKYTFLVARFWHSDKWVLEIRSRAERSVDMWPSGYWNQG
jgi:hypothetical protein